MLTVGSLVEDPLIRTRVIAGRGGLDRVVTWAHTCELADPWNWMSAGDLLMSDGYGFPPGASEQVEFVENLERAGISALALAEGFVAPTLTARAIAAADGLAFPLLTTARSVPFVTIGRIVAERNQARSGSRAAQVLRLYEVLRRSHGHQMTGDTDLLNALGRELGAALNVVDLRRARELVPAPTALGAPLREAVLTCAREHRGLLPGFSRVGQGTETVLLVPVGDGDAAALVIRVLDGREPSDLVLLAQHVAMIVGLEVERRAAQASRARDRGSILVRHMLDATIAPEVAESQLHRLGLGHGPWRVTAWQGFDRLGGDPWANSDSSDHLVDWEEAIVQCMVGGVHLVVVPDSETVDDLDSLLVAAGVSVGISQPFTSASRFADAAREARWALEGARASGTQYAVYGSHGSYFMPRTLAEGEAVVRRLLGPIIDYDAANDTDLVNSLRVFFSVNRSWQEGARQLGIHKQTLVYRIKKVEELTGSDLRDFGTQAELFLALRTWGLLSTGDR